MEIERKNVGGLPPPGGHYVHAVKHQGLVYISGQLPILPDGEHRPWLPFVDQARQAMENLLHILSASGSGPENLLKVTVFLVGAEHWSAFNQLFAQMLGEVRPARSIVPVSELHHGYLIEIEAIAAG